MRPPGPLALSCGDLSLSLDENGAFLRAITFRGEELFRGIGFVVRDGDWGTYALAATPEIVETASGLRVTAQGVVVAPTGRLDWRLVWSVAARGITAEVEARSADGFQTARTGLVVLHALAASRGRAVSLTHAETGGCEETCFPTLVSPHQPFFDIAGMAYETASGHALCLTFAGEVFEAEDQRNWTDASYKTYSRPLAKPFPYAIGPDRPERQSLTVAIEAVGAARAMPALPRAEVARVVRMPLLGTSIAPGTSVVGLGAALDALAPGFTALELDLAAGDPATDLPALIDVVPGALRLDIRPAPAATVLDLLGHLASRMHSREVIGVTLWGADEALLAAARAALPGLALGSGSGAFFTELNRGQAWPDSADYLSWTTTPTVHGDTDDTIGESVEPLPDILQTALARWPAARFQIGPMTLGMRFNPNATSAEGRAKPAPCDPRQGAEIAAAWMLGHIAGFAHKRVPALTAFEASGPRGMMASDGALTPAGRLFRRLTAWQGAAVSVLTWPGAPRLLGLRRDGPQPAYALANCAERPQSLLLPEGGAVTLGGYATLWLDQPPA